MSTSSFPYSKDIQESSISASLNASMLLNVLIGIYTMVYAGTVYIYMSKNVTNINRRIVLSAISILYLLCFWGFILQWYFVDWAVVINGGTRESIFIAALGEGPQWMAILANSLFIASFIVSDALLIWRCYHIWGRSSQVILVPLVLFVAEFGLFVSDIVVAVLLVNGHIGINGTLLDNIQSAQVFVSLGTTVIATALIGYRVHSALCSVTSASRKLFSHTAALVIESAAAYTLVLLVYAVFIVTPAFATVGSPWVQADYYVEAVLNVVAGLAPTVLVARIAITNSNTTSLPVTHISGLQFESQQGNSQYRSDVTEKKPNASRGCIEDEEIQ